VRAGDRVISNDIAGWVDGPAPSLVTNSATIAGRLARHVVIDAELLVSAPARLSAHEAATLPTAGLTAWMAIVELGKVNAAQTVVVQGTGRVALFATQFALAHGARVIVTTTSEEKMARLGALGRVEAINRRKRCVAVSVLNTAGKEFPERSRMMTTTLRLPF
jgi:NADPH:quinone reductase-like Zn-dependent oxidoreductase